MFSLASLLLTGCNSSPVPDRLAVDDALDPVDPIAAAFAECTTTRSDLLNDAAYATDTSTHDANGDAVSGTHVYAEYTELESTWVATFGAPHELTSQTVTYPDAGEYDYAYTADWEDGHVVYSAYDFGNDADLDNELWNVYDRDDLVHYESDTDGDDVVDESADCTTVAEGDGTRLTCDGTVTAGGFTSEEVFDADGHILQYDYLDDAGVESHATWYAYGLAGESGNRDTERLLDSVVTYEDATTVEFDTAGRRGHQLNTQVDHTMEDAITTFEYTYAYDCP